MTYLFFKKRRISTYFETVDSNMQRISIVMFKKLSLKYEKPEFLIRKFIIMKIYYKTNFGNYNVFKWKYTDP